MKTWSLPQNFTMLLANIAIASLFYLFLPVFFHYGSAVRTYWYGGLFCFAFLSFNFVRFCIEGQIKRKAGESFSGFYIAGLSWVMWVAIFFLGILPTMG